MSLPIREVDKENAARAVAAWLIEGGGITGFPNAYGDAKFVRNKKQIFLVCDFVSSDASLSNDPRVERVPPEKDKEVYEANGFGETDYIGMKKIAESPCVIVVELSNYFGPLGGHVYQFEFRRKIWGLRAKGKLVAAT